MKSVRQKDIACPENNKDGQVSENDQSQKGARFLSTVSSMVRPGWSQGITEAFQ